LKARGSPVITGRSSGARVTRSTPLSRAFSASRFAAIEQGCPRRERLRRNFEIAGFHLGHVEDAVDHRQQVLAGIVDQLRIFLAARRVDQSARLPARSSRRSDDGVQRRAQFHGSWWRGNGFFDASACSAAVRASFQRLFLHLAVGDVAHHGDHFGLSRCLLERPAPHLDPDEIGGKRPGREAPSRRSRNSTLRASPSRAASDSAVR